MNQVFCIAPRNIPTEKHDTFNPFAHFSTDLQHICYMTNVLHLLDLYAENGIGNVKIATVLDKRFASAKNASKAAAKQAQLNHYFTT